MALTGLNKPLAKETHKKAQRKIEDLRTNVNALKTAVQTMNQNIWYGGNSANKWYDNVSQAHTSNTKFIDSALALQNAIKNDISGIEDASNRNNSMNI